MPQANSGAVVPAEVVEAVVELALRWRYDQDPPVHDQTQRIVDGLELLQLLQDHGVRWYSDYANKVIPAPAISYAGGAGVQRCLDRGGILGSSTFECQLPVGHTGVHKWHDAICWDRG